MRETMPGERVIELLPREGGRRVGVYTLAQGGAGRTIVLCHAAPGAALFDPDPAQTQARGVTLLALDRPGYGRSDPMPAAGGLEGLRPSKIVFFRGRLCRREPPPRKSYL